MSELDLISAAAGSGLPLDTIALRLVVATLFGAAIGFEREWRDRSAGLRTHILVSLAAATVTLLTIEVVHLNLFDSNSVRIDPIRVIEAVTSGVAFLAAGLIVFSRGEVRGLTTGAGMWLAGTVGMATGLGFFAIAALTTLLTLIVLFVLRYFERKTD